jgi:nicotinamidase-related amidase
MQHEHEHEARSGKPALVVIDVQNGVVADGHDIDGVVGRIAQMIDHARACEIPVVYVQHEDDELVPGTDAWQIRSELAPQAGEPVIHKHYPDTFAETNFAETLEQLGIGELVITGAQTDACVQSTLYGALRHGYQVTLVSDAHTTSPFTDNGVTFDPAVTIAHLNVVGRFLSYPGARSQVASTAEILAR